MKRISRYQKASAGKSISSRLASLLAIARRRFAAQRYAGTTLAEVAEDAGIRKASLYYHFTTKESLHKAVLDEIVTGLCQRIAQASIGTADVR